MFGNISFSEIEARLGIKFPQDIAYFMSNNHQASAQNVMPGKWHCFDIPFNLVCGDIDTAKKIYGAIKDKSGIYVYSPHKPLG